MQNQGLPVLCQPPRRGPGPLPGREVAGSRLPPPNVAPQWVSDSGSVRSHGCAPSSCAAWAVDPELCPKCGKEMKRAKALNEQHELQRLLNNLGIGLYPARPRHRAVVRLRQPDSRRMGSMGRRLTPVAARFALAHPVEIQAKWPLNCPKATKRLSSNQFPLILLKISQGPPTGSGAMTSYRLIWCGRPPSPGLSPSATRAGGRAGDAPISLIQYFMRLRSTPPWIPEIRPMGVYCQMRQLGWDGRVAKLRSQISLTKAWRTWYLASNSGSR